MHTRRSELIAFVLFCLRRLWQMDTDFWRFIQSWWRLSIQPTTTTTSCDIMYPIIFWLWSWHFPANSPPNRGLYVCLGKRSLGAALYQMGWIDYGIWWMIFSNSIAEVLFLDTSSLLEWTKTEFWQRSKERRGHYFRPGHSHYGTNLATNNMERSTWYPLGVSSTDIESGSCNDGDDYWTVGRLRYWLSALHCHEERRPTQGRPRDSMHEIVSVTSISHSLFPSFPAAWWKDNLADQVQGRKIARTKKCIAVFLPWSCILVLGLSLSNAGLGNFFVYFSESGVLILPVPMQRQLLNCPSRAG